MRCADFGPTPGRQRSASIERRRAAGAAVSDSDAASERQLHARRQAACRPSSLPIFSCVVASALRTASLNAAATRSSSMSLSSASRLGSIDDALHVVLAGHRRPSRGRRPTGPRPRSCASSSCAFFMFSCISCACFISPPSPPFIMASPLLVWLPAASSAGRMDERDDLARPGRAPGRARTGSSSIASAALACFLPSRATRRARLGRRSCPPAR